MVFVFPNREILLHIRKTLASLIFCYGYMVLDKTCELFSTTRRLSKMKKLMTKALLLGAIVLSASVAFSTEPTHLDGGPIPNCGPAPLPVCGPNQR